MHYFTLEQRESLQRQLEQRACELQLEISQDRLANLDAEPEAAALGRDVEELRAVEQALARLHEPEFGVCEDCRIDIPYTRLLAAPFATRCVACQAEFEGRRHLEKAA
jgi:DnaK suppressor protein